MKNQKLAILFTSALLSCGIAYAQSSDFNSAGLKLRGNGTVDDTQPGRVAGANEVRREDRQADRQLDRREDRQADRREDRGVRQEGVARIDTVRVARVERPEKIEKVEKPEKIEKVEKVEKVEKPEKVEKVERPENRSGRG